MARALTAGDTVEYVVSLDPAIEGDTGWRLRLTEGLRPEVERYLHDHPEANEFSLTGALFTAHLRRVSGHWCPGACVRLRFEGKSKRSGAGRPEGGVEHVTRFDLPDASIQAVGQGLVGLDQITSDILLDLECRWTDRVVQWSRSVRKPIPEPFQRSLDSSAALYILHGDPGTGKTSCAVAVGDTFCRQAKVAGTLLHLSTAGCRGNGLVGDFGRQIKAAFDAALVAARRGPVFVAIDEGDVLAAPRSGGALHHEDKAGTGALLEALDRLTGRQVAVLITTNLLDAIDAAVRRRAAEIAFPRPSATARRAIIQEWWPAISKRVLDQAVTVTEELTPADLVRSLREVQLRAIRDGVPVGEHHLLNQLQLARKTGRV